MDENATAGPAVVHTAQPIDRGVLEILDNAQINSPMRERLLCMHKKSGIHASPVRFSAQHALRAFQGSPVRRRKHSRYAPEAYAALLRATVPVGRIKCLRTAIASESPAWIKKFLAAGAAEALVHRIDDICALNWREDADETMLHELVRCVLALGTSEPGRVALAAQAPNPFLQLSELLFRGMRPAALSTRRHIIECLQLLTRLDVIVAVVDAMVSQIVCQVPAHALRQARVLGVPRGVQLAFALMHSADSCGSDKVPFLRCERPRVLRDYCNELTNTAAEFFWVFCHPENEVWDANGDECAAARAPRAPSSITASVEWDAMAYLTAHLGLLNTLARALGHTEALSDELLGSGFAQVPNKLRRASQTYYADLHVELAHLARWLAPRDEVASPDSAPHAPKSVPMSPTMLAPPAHATVSSIRRVHSPSEATMI